MLDNIQFYKKYEGNPAYTVMIPTWNNLDFLRCCIDSLHKNSTLNHQVVVFVNEGTDGTIDWLKKQEEIDFIVSPVNAGICYALNLARTMAQAEYLVYFNDDMYALPSWDDTLIGEAKKQEGYMFMLSATMIEPYDSNNPCVSFANYGDSIATFKEEELLKNYTNYTKTDWSGSTWPPNLIPTLLWDAVGGLSIEYHPGIYSDPDLSKKLWTFGVRNFRGVGQSLVYHFGRQSTGKLKGHKGRETFLGKWNESSGTFTRHYLRIGQAFTGPLAEAKVPMVQRLKDLAKRKRIIKP